MKEMQFVIAPIGADLMAVSEVRNFFATNPNAKEYPVKTTIANRMGIAVYLENRDQAKLGILKCIDGTAVNINTLKTEGFEFDEKKNCISDYEGTITRVRFDGSFEYRLRIEILERHSTEAATEILEDYPSAQEMMKAGIADQQDLAKDLQIMLENRFPGEMIEAVFNSHLRMGNETDSISSDSWYVPSSEIDDYLLEAAQDLVAGFHVVFSGGQSTGKTKCAATLADIFGRKIIVETASGSKSWQEMVAPKTTDNSGADALCFSDAEDYVKYNSRPELYRDSLKGAARYEMNRSLAASTRIITELTPLIDAMKNGYWYCLDEMNCADPNVLEAVLNPILDGTQYLMIPGFGKVKVHPNFRLLATQNPGFAGTMEQNQATLSRLSIINVTYGTSAKAQLLQALKPLETDGYPIDMTVLNKIDKLYSEITKAYENRTIGDQCISIRGFARAITVYTKFGGSLKNAVIRHVVSHAARKDKNVIMQLVDQRLA